MNNSDNINGTMAEYEKSSTEELLDIWFGKRDIFDESLIQASRMQERYKNAQRQADDERAVKATEAMTMRQAYKMIQRAYIYNDIQNKYNGKYTNADKWLAGEGAKAVSQAIRSNVELNIMYDDVIYGKNNYGRRLYDVIRAYQKGKLIGKTDNSPIFVTDLQNSVKVYDKRFYAPKEIENAKKVFETACGKIDSANRNQVVEARAKILLYAHNKGAAETLGITQSELNKKLQTWTNYSAKAKEISMTINNNVGVSNRWTGIENMSWVSRKNVTKSELERMVKSVEGIGKKQEYNYIARTMLALDTHIDWSWLNFEFTSTDKLNEDLSGSAQVLGVYIDEERKVKCTPNSSDTVAHEMGHALDWQWGRELGVPGKNLTSDLIRVEDIIEDDQVRAWYKHFKELLADLKGSSDVSDSYSGSIHETFARFVAKFVEWAESIGSSDKNRVLYSNRKDMFTVRQYIEFARILQEKAMLDTKGLTGNKYWEGKCLHLLRNESTVAWKLEQTQPMDDELGERQMHYLKEHKNATYSAVLIDGKINGEFVDFEHQTEEMYFSLKNR